MASGNTASGDAAAAESGEEEEKVEPLPRLGQEEGDSSPPRPPRAGCGGDSPAAAAGELGELSDETPGRDTGRALSPRTPCTPHTFDMADQDSDEGGDEDDEPDASHPEMSPSTKAAEANSYLESLDFPVWDAAAWKQGALPELRVRVLAHKESEKGRTLYQLEGELRAGGGQEPLKWSAERRLAHLRKRLHDPVKLELGDRYKQVFKTTPFAHHLAPPGTTGRLNAWCQTMAECVNAGLLCPTSVAQVLRELGAPGSGGADARAEEDASKLQDAI